MRFDIAALALAAGLVAAHPTHDVREEAMERRDFLNSVKRADLSHCAPTLKARGVEARNAARRAATVDAARVKRGLYRRDADDVLDKSHNQTGLGFTPVSSYEDLFAGMNSCLLSPEVTQGPYYVGGEYVRRNVIESQAGVGTIMDFQVIDVDTCDPVPNVYLEIWHCNATGVYSGIVAGGNGDETDESNIDNTWLRGIQQTDSDGVAQFESIFPGHYTGRTAHVHVMVHTGAHLYPNGTLGNVVSSSHVGQTFFDQDLITAVELTAPYNTNTQELTTNADDGILLQEAADVDPMMLYTPLAEDIADGLFAWIAFGINTTSTTEITPAAYYYKEGGVANPDAGSGPGGPPPSGVPTMPPRRV